MRTSTRVFIVMGIALLTLGTFYGPLESEFPLAQKPIWKFTTGFAAAGIIGAQWALTLVRMVFQAHGVQWDRWVRVHRSLGLVLPLAVMAHAQSLGYGLLAILPLALFAAAWTGTQLRKTVSAVDGVIRWHIFLSAITLGSLITHLYMVTFYR
ncbi:MAG: hypothetical protein ACPGYK_01990 [Flavobacteriales bacterium]